VCVRLCVVRWLEDEKILPQPSWSQANSLVPVCTPQCFLRSLRLKKRLSQPSCAQASVCSANIGNGLCTESGLGGLETATFMWDGRSPIGGKVALQYRRLFVCEIGIAAPQNRRGIISIDN
jgi:hypothetical protein